MKRIVSLMLVVLLVMSAAITNTYAMGNIYKSTSHIFYRNESLPRGIAKIFKDIAGYDWAEKYIEKMAIKGIIKGDGQGCFAPKRAVTKLEAIIMALRVMGYEDLANRNLDQIKRGAKKLRNKSKIDVWAYGYVAVALEKGILDEVDLIDMNLREPAKRHEVAKYIIRALGHEKEAQKHMKRELRFIDAGAVPLGSVGYVYLADKKGIIKGYPDRTFRPNRSVTRAEMAVLISRLDDNVDNDIDKNEELAEIVKINNNRLTLKVNNKNKVYKVLKNAPVYTEDGKYTSIYDLEVGMKVKIQLNDKKVVIFIEIKEYEEDFRDYVGIVKEIDDDEIEIKSNGKKMEFDIEDEDMEVQFNNKKGNLDDIREGDKVKIRVNEDKEVKHIRVYRQLGGKEYTGVVDEIDEDEIEIKVNGKKMEFDIEDTDIEVQFNNKKGSLEDIREGDKVKIRVNEDEEVEYIRVYRQLGGKEYTGIVDEIDEDEIEIKINGNKMEFDIEDEDIEVQFNNKKGSLDDIREGDKVKIRVNEDEEVEYIRVYRYLGGKEYAGVVEEIDEDEIEIKSNGKKMEFDIAEDADIEVQFNNKKGSLEHIREGDKVKVRVNEDEEVEYIRVYRRLDYDVYEGLFLETDGDKLSIISIKKTIEFEVDSDVKVKFKDKEGDVDDLIVGDEVKVITLEDDDEVLWIEVDRNYNDGAITGTLTRLYKDQRQIAIKEHNKIKIYDYSSNVKVFVNDDKGRLSDLEEGDKVYLVLDDDKVKEIRAYRVIMED
ncbi:MAG: S-layer homology domain-containing protein [Clostridia bacterium]|nr:S-layer homology domain-containing protein [Clostridia bacterium]